MSTTCSKHLGLPSIEIGTVHDLRLFMEHHVFAVWDFMSLLKYLQKTLAPARVPWLPPANPEAARLVNEIVLHEESDEAFADDGFGNRHESHFQTYLRAMEEVGANTLPVRHFLELVESRGIWEALKWARMPEPSRNFLCDTFRVIAEDRPHCVAAVFAHGRENLLPVHFENLLNGLRLDTGITRIFRHYLQRHIDLDGDDHGPAARRLVSALCRDNALRLEESSRAGTDAVASRRRLIQEIAAAIRTAKRRTSGQIVSWKILHQPAGADHEQVNSSGSSL